MRSSVCFVPAERVRMMERLIKNKIYTISHHGFSFTGVYSGSYYLCDNPKDKRLMFAFKNKKQREDFTEDYMYFAKVTLLK